jgi:hypothetical protein
MHDWSKLDFKTHKSKMDKVQLTRKNDVGYDLTASLSFFKLVKSSGQQIECWQQSDGMAIMRRLLVGSMACVYVWRLLADESEEAAQKREHLMKLSGRQTKRGVRATASGLLAGWYALLSVLSLLESGTTVEQLRKYAQTHAPPGLFCVETNAPAGEGAGGVRVVTARKAVRLLGFTPERKTAMLSSSLRCFANFWNGDLRRHGRALAIAS